VRKAIDEAIAAIDAIEDFEHNATDAKVGVAQDKVKVLEGLLKDEVLALLAK
jgi:hypothetical protein